MPVRPFAWPNEVTWRRRGAGIVLFVLFVAKVAAKMVDKVRALSTDAAAYFSQGLIHYVPRQGSAD